MYKDFLITSVGGQGGLLTAGILAQVFCSAGFDVKTSEIHGMAQRGGSVITHVRRDRKVYAPAVPKGSADMIIGLEILEAYRALGDLKPGGVVVTSDERIMPVPVILGAGSYPEISKKSFEQVAGHAYVVPAVKVAEELGNRRVSNMVCLGVVSKLLECDETLWVEAIKSLVPRKTVDTNLAAFRVGRNTFA